MSHDISSEDIQKTAELLRVLQPGFLPYPIFEQVARLVALPILEFVPLRTVNNATEVLLIARPDDDALWPGLLHTPGTVIRATDLNKGKNTNWPAFQRIAEDELAGTKIGAPHYVGSIFHESKRGAEQAQLYWVEVEGAAKVGEFYAVDGLPEGLMESQLIFIRQSAKDYENRKLS